MPSKESPNILSSSSSTPRACDLCGLALNAGRFEAAFCGKTYLFCCLGCRQVFSILIEATGSGDPEKFRESDLFKQCVENGIIPRSEADLVSLNVDGNSDGSPSGKAETLESIGQSATSRDGV